MFSLFPDQSDLVARVRKRFGAGDRSVCLQLPTGGGKTVIAGHIMTGLHAKGGRALVLAHRREIVRQFAATLDGYGLHGKYAFCMSGQAMSPWAQHQLASVQTIVRRQMPGFTPTMIVVDEAHHASADSYRKIIERWPEAKVLGMTATPERLDGKPLLDIFQTLVCGPTPRQLIENNRLSPYRLLSLETAATSHAAITKRDFSSKELNAFGSTKAIGDIEGAYFEHAEGKRCIIFTANVTAAKETAEALSAKGVRAAAVDGSMPDWERSRIIQDFTSGNISCVVNCDIISEGFDCPAANCIIMARPTKSLTVYMQQAGRGLRYEDGKVALILDLAGNVERFGPPCTEREWTLEGKATKPKKPSEREPSFCQTCGEDISAARRKRVERCPVCNTLIEYREAPEQDKTLKLVEIELGGVKLVRAEGKPVNRKQLYRAANQAYAEGGYAAIVELGKMLGYNPGWAKHAHEYVKRSR